MSRKYFSINGYWKDTKEPFENYIVTNYDDMQEGSEHNDEDIFLFGYDEENLKESLNKTDGANDFVITSYELIEKTKTKEKLQSYKVTFTEVFCFATKIVDIDLTLEESKIFRLDMLSKRIVYTNTSNNIHQNWIISEIKKNV
jgi:hypothetical protein